MVLVAQRTDRYLHAPRLVEGPDGTATLHLIAWQGEHESHLALAIGSDGTPGDERVIETRPRIVTLTRGGDVRASDDAADEQRESRAGERTWVEHDGGITSVF